ncbi:MAG: hypothetical protein IPO95_12370 [Rhodanobacteraceae bacterium]|nr:hypothetical protein [Rhodanobacteraceae bacterium]
MNVRSQVGDRSTHRHDVVDNHVGAARNDVTFKLCRCDQTFHRIRTGVIHTIGLNNFVVEQCGAVLGQKSRQNDRYRVVSRRLFRVWGNENGCFVKQISECLQWFCEIPDQLDCGIDISCLCIGIRRMRLDRSILSKYRQRRLYERGYREASITRLCCTHHPFTRSKSVGCADRIAIVRDACRSIHA